MTSSLQAALAKQLNAIDYLGTCPVGLLYIIGIILCADEILQCHVDCSVVLLSRGQAQ